MRRALSYILVAALFQSALPAAERKTWKEIRYAGGTVDIKTSPFEWNTTLTVTMNPDSISVTIAPATIFSGSRTVRFQPSQVVSLSMRAGAWRKVAEVPGARLPPKPSPLFGLLDRHSYFGIVYENEGKRGALLLDSLYSWQILRVLEALSNKTVEYSP